jgi:hypothetical protein
MGEDLVDEGRPHGVQGSRFFFEANTVGGVPHCFKNLNKPKGVYVQAGQERKKRGRRVYHYIKRYSPKTK